MSQNAEKLKYVKLAYANEDLVFSSEEGWNILAAEVENHGIKLSRNLGRKVSFNDELFSYYETVYKPLKLELDSFFVRMAFRKELSGDLYLEAANHWNEMMKEDSEIYTAEAVSDLIATRSRGFLSKLIKGTVTGNDNDRGRKKAA